MDSVWSVEDVLREDGRREAAVHRPFNPITGEGSTGERVRVEIAGWPIGVQWLPVRMLRVPMVRRLVEAGLDGFMRADMGMERWTAADVEAVVRVFTRTRCRYDFAFWAAMFVYIKRKGGGEDCLFRLTRPQRRFVELLEGMREAGRPIRVVLLKARQWGGSTTSQIYMAWLQLVHRVGLNSLIVAHQGSGSDEIKAMFDRMMSRYPVWMLHGEGEACNEGEAKTEGVGKSGSITRVVERGCNIKIGTAERPDSCRGGDYNLVHLSEVGVWRQTDGKRPEDIVRSACSGVLLRPWTMIVYESTANGTGNFFHREYKAAAEGDGRSQMRAMFVGWYDIDLYRMEWEDEAERAAFARRLVAGRVSEGVRSEREESGKYLWWLWERGATLAAIRWYVEERRKYNDHGQMAAEYPSDDVEAFVHSGARVFDKYRVEALRRTCRVADWRGEVVGNAESGKEALAGLRFVEDGQGRLSVWSRPDVGGDETMRDRYVAVVDVGGRGEGADWSVVTVFDRAFMADGGKPVVVAQWYGHTDMDLLAWNAARIASWYGRALLVIESNTIETHDRDRAVDGDQSAYLLSEVSDVYPNLYARRQSEEEIRQGAPRKWGFHTNVATKPMVVSTLVKVVREGLYVERDERALDEMIEYERRQNGSFGAVAGCHDDLLMTRAIGLHVMLSEMDAPRWVRAEDLRTGGRRRSAGAAVM